MTDDECISNSLRKACRALSGSQARGGGQQQFTTLSIDTLTARQHEIADILFRSRSHEGHHGDVVGQLTVGVGEDRAEDSVDDHVRHGVGIREQGA